MNYDEAKSLLAEIRELDAKSEHRIEDLRRADEILDTVTKARREQDRAAMRDQIEAIGTPSHVAGEQTVTTAYDALQKQGWKLGENASVDPGLVLNVEVKDLIDDVGDANPLRVDGIRPEGTDRRYLFPALGAVNLGEATRVDELVSKGRTLPNIAQTRQPLGATGQKPAVSSETELATYTPEMIAVLSDPHPNSLVGLPAFRALVNEDLATAYREGVDQHCTEALIMDAGGTGDDGDDLIEKLRKAVTAIEAEGFNPRIAAVSPTDAETLDLMRVGGSTANDGPFLLPPAPRSQASSPLWNLEIRVVKNLAHPIVLDPSGVRFYVGPVSFDSDPYSNFGTNETVFRYEGPVCCIVRQPGAVFVVGETGS